MKKDELLMVFPTPVQIYKYEDSIEKELKYIENVVNNIFSPTSILFDKVLSGFASSNKIEIAADVFLPKGSRRIFQGEIFISRICSATIKRCSSLQIQIGSSLRGIPLSLSNVCCSNVLEVSEFNDKYCFG